DLSEWEVFNTNFVIPLFEAEIPFGVSSGNHDVGGVSSYYKDGANTLDQNLVYDYYYEYLGEEFFNTKDYYGESFLNNRSHYDLMTINGHEFLFLYLGWGSSTPYIHVSSLDMDWAKTILEKYPEKTVVLATHEYMGNKGNRSVTGEMVFNNLVKEYENIKFVLSGHINGSSHRIDAIDDNGDGINDRLVLQLLTNYQEEENLFGATFIRSIGLDFDNNLIYFDHYSPYFKDYDLKLEDNYEYSKKSQAFYYAFDLSNCGYGILTDYFG
ncbi:MAG: metallophosphoesterase, partial [Bacilli bacterium]|nr:metallophosphoesterase [Bacilli bacterium]